MAACRLCNWCTSFLDFKTLVELPPRLLRQIRTGRSKQPGYKYQMVRQRRELLKKGYRFDRKRAEWVKSED